MRRVPRQAKPLWPGCPGAGVVLSSILLIPYVTSNTAGPCSNYHHAPCGEPCQFGIAKEPGGLAVELLRRVGL